MRPIDLYFMEQEEPLKSCLLTLREMILNYDDRITETWKYRMPVYCFDGKMMCYLWVHKKYRQPYLGIVEGRSIDHPGLLMEKRSRMKIMLFDPGKDLPVNTVKKMLKAMVVLY